MHDTIKSYEIDHAQNMIERDTFKHKISEMSLTNAKTKLQKTGTGKSDQILEQYQLPGPKYDQIKE